MVPLQHSALRGAFEWVAVIAIALVATFLIRTFVVEPFVVPTGSMEDTIEIGDQILAQKVSLELGQPVKQGELVAAVGFSDLCTLQDLTYAHVYLSEIINGDFIADRFYRIRISQNHLLL